MSFLKTNKMISFSPSWTISIGLFLLFLGILYYVYQIRKQLSFQQSVLESLQHQILQSNRILERHEHVLVSLTGMSTSFPTTTTPSSSSKQELSSPSNGSGSPSSSSIPQGLMSNFMYLMNAVASTPPSPDTVLEQGLQEYQRHVDPEDTEDDDSLISEELEQELRELQVSKEILDTIPEGRLDEKEEFSDE